MSALRIRMQPWLTRPGISSGRSVPWIPMNPPPGQSVRRAERAAAVSRQSVAEIELAGGSGRCRASDAHRRSQHASAVPEERCRQVPTVDDEPGPYGGVSAKRVAGNPAGRAVRQDREAYLHPYPPVLVDGPRKCGHDVRRLLRRPAIEPCHDPGRTARPRSCRDRPPHRSPAGVVTPFLERHGRADAECGARRAGEGRCVERPRPWRIGRTAERRDGGEHAARDERYRADRQPVNRGRFRLDDFITSNFVDATMPSVLCFERGSSNASAAGVMPASRLIHAACRASTVWIASAGTR
jgi:hypothetical protein